MAANRTDATLAPALAVVLARLATPWVEEREKPVLRDAARRLAGRIRALEAGVRAETEVPPPPPAQDDSGGPYEELVGRIRAAVDASVPEGSCIAVVSKGDPELLRLGRRQALHFPQGANGQYAGHYPPDGQAAVEHLEAVIRYGADHLLLPRTALWWLDYYAELGAYLEHRCRKIVDEAGACLVFELSSPPRNAAELSARVGPVKSPGIVLHTVSLAGAILPAGAQLALVTGLADGEAVVEERVGTGASAKRRVPVERLQALAGIQTDYLAVPADPALAELVAAIRRAFTPVVDRDGVGTIFRVRLGGQSAEPRSKEREDT